MRARIAIYHACLSCELREVSLKSKPNEMLLVSPKSTVPVLVVNNTVIDESIDIMKWALTNASSEIEQWSVDELSHPLVTYNDGKFKTELDRYKYYDRHPEQVQEVYFENAIKFIDLLEDNLVENVDNELYFTKL